MQIGIISDTHNRLPFPILQFLGGVDLIIHAGDIGQSQVLDTLSTTAPTHAVRGNSDSYSLAISLPRFLLIQIEDLQVYIQHHIGELKPFYFKLQEQYRPAVPDVVIFGHTHRWVYQRFERTLFINPGSAGQPRGGTPPTAMKLTLQKNQILNHELFELLY